MVDMLAGAICATQCTVASAQTAAQPSGSGTTTHESACRLHLGLKGLAPVFTSCRLGVLCRISGLPLRSYNAMYC